MSRQMGRNNLAGRQNEGDSVEGEGDLNQCQGTERVSVQSGQETCWHQRSTRLITRDREGAWGESDPVLDLARGGI